MRLSFLASGLGVSSPNLSSAGYCFTRVRGINCAVESGCRRLPAVADPMGVSERGTCRSNFHVPPLVNMGEGKGVTSPTAVNGGDDRTDEGDKEPVLELG